MKTLTVGVLLSFAYFGIAEADQVQAQVTFSKWISDREDGSRVLLSCPLPKEIDRQLVVSAYLDLSLAGLIPTKRIEVTLAALGAPWSSDATWSTPWSTPGGDLDGARSEDFTLSGGRQASTIRVNVTQLVRAVAEGSRANHGMILLPADPLRIGFDGEEKAVLGALSDATLTVSYTDLKKLGYRDGAKALRERRRTARVRDAD